MLVLRSSLSLPALHAAPSLPISVWGSRRAHSCTFPRSAPLLPGPGWHHLWPPPGPAAFLLGHLPVLAPVDRLHPAARPGQTQIKSRNSLAYSPPMTSGIQTPPATCTPCLSAGPLPPPNPQAMGHPNVLLCPALSSCPSPTMTPF